MIKNNLLKTVDKILSGMNRHIIGNGLRCCFHVFCICVIFVVCLFSAYLFFMNYDNDDYELRVMFVLSPGLATGWNIAFQTLFLSLSLVYDVLEWLDKHQTELGKKLAYYRDITFSGLVVPFTLFVSTMFWSVYTIDRELVFPKVYDQIVPWWFNHCVHTNITVVVLVETVLQSRRYPRNKKIELTAVAVVGVLYAIVYYTIYYFTRRWLYAVFGIMTWWQVCLYQMLIWASTFIFYYMQFPINRIFHREEATEEQKIAEDSNIQKNGTIPTKSWSLKYRTMRKQFENSNL